MEIYSQTRKKPPVINCHTHIFTGNHVPPYLAKTFLPWPFYYLLPLSGVVSLFRWWYRGPYTWKFTRPYRRLQAALYKFKMTINRSGVLRVIHSVLSILVTIHVFFIVAGWLTAVQSPGKGTEEKVSDFEQWLDDYYLLYLPTTLAGKLLLILLLLILFKGGRNLLWFVLRRLWSFLGVLPGPKSAALARRYMLIGRFSFYNHQARIFARLRAQYPSDSGFVVLPMDMEYMGAGTLKKEHSYRQQMKVLAAIKNKSAYAPYIYPFVFADPRRINQEGSAYFAWKAVEGRVVLDYCFIQEYIEQHRFSGFKIYPALGYYPFDEALLPLWKYAADQALPIITHCIRGTIFYRGRKEKAWDIHPIFQQSDGKGSYEPLTLLEMKNSEFCNNFTHPLNYICLLEEELLRRVVGYAKDDRVRELFGYTDEKTELKHNLNHLKLCFGHFGGDDEWDRFLERDRDNYTSALLKNPSKGVSFLADDRQRSAPGKLEQLWKYADWYTLICSMMLQKEYVYADISYILQNTDIRPLLRQTLTHEHLRQKVLFGTDFYVVRNHKSEKSMLAEMILGLSENDFDQIARVNPRAFLCNKLHGSIYI